MIFALAWSTPERASALSVSIAAALGALALARPPLGWFVKRWVPGCVLIAVLCVPLFWVGERERAFGLLARAMLALTVAVCAASSVREEELAPALRTLGLPAGLTLIVQTMLRQLSRVKDAARSLILARKLRGARGPAVGARMLSALLIRTADRAERVGLALELRGGPLPSARTRFCFSAGDATFLSAAGCAALLIAWTSHGP